MRGHCGAEPLNSSVAKSRQDGSATRSKTVAVSLPLLALLAVTTPPGAWPGPPERPSARMILDAVPEGLRQYRAAPHEGKRIEWLRRLAPSRDPRVAVELRQVFAFASDKPSVAIRKAAKKCLAARYVIQDGRQLAETGLSSESEWRPCVCAWWSKNGADVRCRAKQLPQ
jgi:hypothetical protein